MLSPKSVTDKSPNDHHPIRLSKYVMSLIGCSRSQAELYIEGGWVKVDGVVVEEPYFKLTTQQVELDRNAQLTPIEPATILLNKPAGQSLASLLLGLNTDTHWVNDISPVQPCKRHFLRQSELVPLVEAASGLILLSQDTRFIRIIREDTPHLEQEFSVEIEGSLSAEGLRHLQQGHRQGHSWVRYKVSWQNETHLRFAAKGTGAEQIIHACAGEKLKVLSIKRLRIGRIPLSSLPIGYWRYLAPWERF